MKTWLLVLGVALAVGGAAGYLYVTNAAADCDTTPGQVARIGDSNTREQCEMAAVIIQGAMVVAFVGLGVAVLAFLL